MPKGIYDRTAAKKAIRTANVTATPPVIGPTATSGRWCSKCHQVRPTSLFAMTGLEHLGIHNFVCGVCDGTWTEPTAAVVAAPKHREPSQQAVIDQLRADLDAANMKLAKKRVERREPKADSVDSPAPAAASESDEAPEPRIPADAAVNVFVDRLSDNRGWAWSAFVKGRRMKAGSGATREEAQRAGYAWIAEHRVKADARRVS